MSLVSDTHGQVLSRLSQINAGKYAASQTALIILGDAGINFYLNKTDINLKRNIQNNNNNRTRFIVISRELLIDKDADKISLIFSAPHTTGSLYRVLGRFSMAGLNLTKIESRPIENENFSYHFYVDVMGSVRDESTLDLVCALSDELPEFEFLGNFFEYK